MIALTNILQVNAQNAADINKHSISNAAYVPIIQLWFAGLCLLSQPLPSSDNARSHHPFRSTLLSVSEGWKWGRAKDRQERRAFQLATALSAVSCAQCPLRLCVLPEGSQNCLWQSQVSALANHAPSLEEQMQRCGCPSTSCPEGLATPSSHLHDLYSNMENNSWFMRFWTLTQHAFSFF